MIRITNKSDCCGCNGCVQCCPESCITMYEDGEGFLYPEVDESACVDCGLCERVCPVVRQSAERKPMAVYAAKGGNEEIRLQSSSGGVFTALAEEVIKEGGVVFGARFDESWEVTHDYTETVEGLSAFRGSKYVQSRIESSFRQTERFLKAGRKVLFSGTPCQIAGLRRFLRKEYGNLLTVDIVCHGVPSPGVWREYLREETARLLGEKNTFSSLLDLNDRDARVESISFRDKRLGWKRFSFSLTLSVPGKRGARNTLSFSEPLDKNIFMRGFLSNLYLRPSCYACPAKSLKSGSDITIGDFWGIQNIIPEIDDDKGVSLAMVNTIKGEAYHRKILLSSRSVGYEEALRYNGPIERSVRPTRKRESFYSDTEVTLGKRIERLCRLSYGQRSKRVVSGILGKRARRFIKRIWLLRNV